jgi:hypothetical protein
MVEGVVMPRKGQGKNTQDERGTVRIIRIIVMLTDGRKAHYKGNVTRSFTFRDRTVSEVASDIEARMFGSAVSQEAVASE